MNEPAAMGQTRTLTVPQSVAGSASAARSSGTTAVSVASLLARDFLYRGVAVLIAPPLSYVAAGYWLEEFAYRIELGAGVFVAAGAAAMLHERYLLIHSACPPDTLIT